MRIFVIDNDPIINLLTVNMILLKDVTSDIHTFLSGKQALEALHKGGGESLPDLILLDLDMPIMDGWEFIEAILR